MSYEPYYIISPRLLSLVEDVADWLEYTTEGLKLTLENVWLRVQTLQLNTSTKLVLRPKQEQLLHLLQDHGSMAPAEIWAALAISRQGAMDLLRPLLEAGMVEKIGGKKSGRYSVRKL
jgi:predicted HTH transcriptional regulator